MKNKGFNKQGLEKAGIKMSVGNGQIILSADQRAAMERQQAAQQIQSLINFRSTCAMNNLGTLIGAYPCDGGGGILTDKETTCKLAREYAEQLMVELKMIPSIRFFRELEAQADKEQQASSTNNIVTE